MRDSGALISFTIMLLTFHNNALILFYIDSKSKICNTVYAIPFNRPRCFD